MRWWDLGRVQAGPAVAFQLSISRSHGAQEFLCARNGNAGSRASRPSPVDIYTGQPALLGGFWVMVLVNVLPSFYRAGCKALRALGLEEVRAPGPLTLGFSFEALRRLFSLNAGEVPELQMPSDCGRGEGSASGSWLLLSLLLSALNLRGVLFAVDSCKGILLPILSLLYLEVDHAWSFTCHRRT